MKFQGLSDQEVQSSREKYGSNAIPESEPTTFWEAFKETFGDPMIKILLVIAAIMITMFFLGYAEIYEPVGTIVAVLIVAFVSAKTSVASDTKYRQLKDSTKKDTCKVYRNGMVTVIEVDDVVVGDKVLLQSGDKIPADGILVDGDLRVDNSALNGEAEECKKNAAQEHVELPDDITGDTFVDQYSLFRGAVVFDGEGILDVRKVGLKTMMGKMAEEMQEEEPDSPLKVKLAKLANQISTFGYIGAVVIAVLYVIFFVTNAGGVTQYLATGWSNILQDVVRAVSLAIVIIVCAVPEGLPLMISLVLMQNTSKMLDHNVLVRKAEGIETAGSLNILFSDKTGTITKGMLEVVEFFTAQGETIPLNEFKDHGKVKGLVDVAIGKNTASLFDASHKVIGGNATDQALMKFIGEETFNLLANNKECVADKFQGFNSANKFSQVHIKSMGKTFYKGAPERLLAVATKALDKDGNEVDLNFDELNEKINELASRAMRVLAFGYSSRELVESRINEDVVLIGLVAIRDDVRPEAKDAIREVQEAGIQVVMITGDRLETAVSIAEDAGLIKNESDKALTSAELNNMTDEEVKAIIKDIRVIARALPTDKSRMVKLCQEMNLVVGMTGDGVNDSPALKRADVGFAMGSGTDIAKESGDIVITDDSFSSITKAVLYGRTIFESIRKFVVFQLMMNLCAMGVSLIGPFMGIDSPVTVIQMLWVNIIMDTLGGLAFAGEPALRRYMLRPSLPRDAGILNGAMIHQILFSGLYSLGLCIFFLNSDWLRSRLSGSSETYYLTVFFAMFIFCGVFNSFNARTPQRNLLAHISANKPFILIMTAVAVIQLMIIYFGGEIFRCVPLRPHDLIFAALLAATVIPADLIRKSLFQKRKKKNAV